MGQAEVVFVVDEVFSPPSRQGPLAVGRLVSGDVSAGDRLAVRGMPGAVVTVVAVDFPTATMLAERRFSLLLSSDLDGTIRAGTTLDGA